MVQFMKEESFVFYSQTRSGVPVANEIFFNEKMISFVDSIIHS